MNPFQQQGAFSWFELITPHTEAAQEFYGQLLGWTLKPGPVGNIPYTVIEAGGQDIGGMAPPPPEQANMPPAWGVYITVDDVDATAEKAKALGGQVLVPPMDIETVGRFSLLQDPHGATFCVITYSQPGA
jgi:predicted enzyme related to lactoylglutathione lyase